MGTPIECKHEQIDDILQRFETRDDASHRINVHEADILSESSGLVFINP